MSWRPCEKGSRASIWCVDDFGHKIYKFNQSFELLLTLGDGNPSERESGIPFNMMSKLLSATDVLFIPRIDSLNSGLVQLGFTYGCVVLGSKFGNIGPP